MYISFVGLSGAGKSTTAKGVREILEQEGYRCVFCYEPFFKSHRTVWYKAVWAVYLLRYFDRQLFLMYYWYRFKLHFKKKRGYLPVVNIYTGLIKKYFLEQIQKGKTDVVIYEEDFLMRSGYYLVEDIADLEKVTKTIEQSVLPKAEVHVQVVVDTPVELATERFIERENVASSHEKREAFESRVEHKKGINKVVAVADDVDGVHTVHIDGTKPPEENIEKVAEVAFALLQERENNSA